ncbi:glycosyltransferase [Micromonospora costi]|uniref:glycosyltransferase n=1 Tax=Micromonospora costi TaxID=1530042 RepID=UPI0033C722EB
MTGTDDRELPWLLVLAVNRWTGTARTDRHIATHLTPFARVLWVDPPTSVVTPAANRFGEPRRVVPRLIDVAPRVTRLVTVAPPFHTRRGIRRLTPLLVRAQIHRALRARRIRPVAALSFSAGDLLGRWGDEVRDVLYVTDDYLAGADLMDVAAAEIAREEANALARADLVVTVSPVLADKWRGLGADPVLVPGGVLSAAYADVDSAPRPPDVDLPGPVAGVVGHLSGRIDVGLLEEVVAAGCSLLLVGTVDPQWEPVRFARLLAHPRVRHVGHRPFADLPSYLRVIDVGLTPYVDSAFNRASFPLKTLEYLAAGRPVVSTDLPAVRWLDTDLIRVAAAGEFGAAVRRAAADARIPELTSRRRRFAAEHSWHRRAELVGRAIGLPV